MRLHNTIRIIRRLFLILTALAISIQVDAMFKLSRHVRIQRNVANNAHVAFARRSAPTLFSHHQSPRANWTSDRMRTQHSARKGLEFGIASLISGFGSLLLYVLLMGSVTAPPALFIFVALLAVSAIVCGAIGFNREGKGMAIVGFSLGLITLVLGGTILALLAAHG